MVGDISLVRLGSDSRHPVEQIPARLELFRLRRKAVQHAGRLVEQRLAPGAPVRRVRLRPGRLAKRPAEILPEEHSRGSLGLPGAIMGDGIAQENGGICLPPQPNQGLAEPDSSQCHRLVQYRR